MSGNYGGNPDEPNVDDFLRDHKEKKKLLDRWPHYFPHEPTKDFDVSEPLTLFLLLYLTPFCFTVAQRFQTLVHSSFLRGLLAARLPAIP